MGFENCEVGFEKKNELGNGIGIPPPPVPSFFSLAVCGQRCQAVAHVSLNLSHGASKKSHIID